MRDIPSAKNLALPAFIVVSIFISQWMRSVESIPTWSYGGQIMGTSFSVKAVHPTEVKLELISEALEAVNERMSTYLPNSELSAINKYRGESAMAISPELRTVLNAAKTVTADSKGHFDVTVGPIVNAWGFGPNKERLTPSAAQLIELKELVGDQKWSLDSRGITKVKPQVYIDLSAIAKGYAVDRVAAALDQAHVAHYWMEVGGEVRVKGRNGEGKLWRVGIERPAVEGNRRVAKIIRLKEMSVATSGDYRNRYEDANGVIRSHTINPKTGEPVKHLLASVSVLHSECMLADAWATALNVMGSERGLALADQLKLAALFIVREGVSEEMGELDGPETTYKIIESAALSDYLKKTSQAD